MKGLYTTPVLSLSTQQFAMHSSIMNVEIINSRKCNNQSLSFKCVYVYTYLCLLCKNNTNIEKKCFLSHANKLGEWLCSAGALWHKNVSKPGLANWCGLILLGLLESSLLHFLISNPMSKLTSPVVTSEWYTLEFWISSCISMIF